jgi:general secretion pathway protein M
VILLLVALAGLHGMVIGPVVEQYRQYDQRLAALVDRLVRYERMAARGELIEARLAVVEGKREPTAAYYLESAKPALASAELQRYVKQTVERAGGRLVSSQVVSNEPEEGFASIAVKVNMQASIEALREVLYRLESENPVVFIDDVVIAAIPQRRVRGRDPSGPMTLRIGFSATAFTRIVVDQGQE